MADRRPLVIAAGQMKEMPSGDKVPISAIATGTPDGTKFVRDDGTLAAISGSGAPVGTIIAFSGSSAPTGYLACPTVATNISRTTYAALFAAIGTLWGAGDGSTTFGMPYFAANHTLLQGGTVGSMYAGQIPAHTHYLYTDPGFGGLGAGSTLAQSTYAGVGYPRNTSSTGSGTDNLAAGRRVLFCVKY